MLEVFDNYLLNYRDFSKFYGRNKNSHNTEDLLREYLFEIGKYPLLSIEEEQKYGKIIQENPGIINEIKSNYDLIDDKVKARKVIRKKEKELEVAKNIMINSNLRLVVSIAKHYVGKGLSLLDLIQEGNMGLMRAVEKFDYSFGNKFSTYATWWIRQSITRALADYGRTIRVPVHMVEKINKLKIIETEFFYKYNRIPSDEELCLELDVSLDYLQKLKKHKEDAYSLNVPIGEDDDTELLDTIPDESVNIEEQFFDTFNHQYLIDLLEDCKLNSREKFILLYRNGFSREDIANAIGEDAVDYMDKNATDRNIVINWGAEDNTLENVGNIYGVSRERIRQIQDKAKAKIKKYLIIHDPELVLLYADFSSKEYKAASNSEKRKQYNNLISKKATPKPMSYEYDYYGYKVPTIKGKNKDKVDLINEYKVLRKTYS